MTLIPSIPHPGPRGRRLFAAALFALVAASGPASADSPSNPMRWEPVTRSVAVFKDGLGFFVKQAEVSLRDGWCVSSDLPPAAFGTLAIYSLVEGHVVDLVGAGPGEIVEFDGLDAPDDLVARRARLESSIGLDVELTYEDDGERRAAPGKLESVGPRFAILESPLGHVAVPVEGAFFRFAAG